jgi:peptide/nickel transport system substrate-binding protein
VDHDEEYTRWTIHLREGVRFSDGSPVDADAVVRALQGHLASELTRPLLRDVESFTAVDALTVEVRTTRPWVAFPALLTGRLGLVPAPATLERLDAARAPIGSGPFVVREWLPGDHVLLARNDRYWRGDDGLPHLDELELRFLPALAERVDALHDGRVDLVAASEPSAGDDLAAIGGTATAVVSGGPRPERRLVFETAQPPFDDVECRRAVAHALDDDAPKASGCDDLSLTITALEGDDLDGVVQRLDDAGIDATVETVDTSRRVLDGLLGDFDAITWTTGAAVDGDERFAELDSRAVAPVGTLSINLGRFDDDDVQAAFLAARADDGDRGDAYDEVRSLLADRVPYVSLGRVTWAFGFDDDIGGVRLGIEAPGGETIVPPAGVLFAAALHRVAS